MSKADAPYLWASPQKAKSLILHIGHGKTGTTSIQRCLRASGDILSNAGILFPDPGPHDNHQLIFPYLWGMLPDDPVQLASLGCDPDAIRAHAARRFEDLKTQIARQTPKHVVLSCENQFRAFPPQAFERITERCAEIAQDVHVIAYLRNPASYMLSKVQQDLKKRPEFVYISQNRIRDVMEPFVDHGPGSITAVRFARDALIGGDVVTDFVTRTLPEIDPTTLSRGQKDENTTISAEAMAALQELHRETRPLPSAIRANKKAFRKILVDTDVTVPGAHRPKLFDDVRSVVESRVTESNWLADWLGITFPELGPPQMSPDLAEVRYLALHDVADICLVDTTRKETLWDAALTIATQQRGILSRLSRWLGVR